MINRERLRFLQNQIPGSRTFSGQRPILQGGRRAFVSPNLVRESFQTMWQRMKQDDVDQYAVPLPDEAAQVVEEYYNSHPVATYENVRGYAITLLPVYGRTLPRALNLLFFTSRIGFSKYEKELRYFRKQLENADRPEPFYVFPMEAYRKWESFIEQAKEIEASYASQGIQLPPIFGGPS